MKSTGITAVAVALFALGLTGSTPAADSGVPVVGVTTLVGPLEGGVGGISVEGDPQALGPGGPLRFFRAHLFDYIFSFGLGVVMAVAAAAVWHMRSRPSPETDDPPAGTQTAG